MRKGLLPLSLLLAGTVLPGSRLFAQALLFRESGGLIPGWDHVAFESEGTVWESHPGYDYRPGYPWPSGFCWDPARPGWHLVPEINGVQNWHSVGSFFHNSAGSTESPTEAQGTCPISANLASAMAFQALMVKGSPYTNNLWWDLSPANQKGGGGSFSCVGLVEYCAEEAGHNGGEGFIPSSIEALCARTIPGHLYGRQQLFSPQLLYECVKNPTAFQDANSYVSGLVDPVDFVLTDPAGRRLGYTEELGLLNEIPEAFYTGDGDVEQFIILAPLPGEYRMELFGLGEEALAVLSTPDDETVFDGHLAAGEARELGIHTCDSGDADGDGDVGFRDYLTVKGHLGMSGAQWRHGDFDGDALVGRSDLLVLRAGFSAEESPPVPAPSTGMLFLPFAAVFLRRGRRTHSRPGTPCRTCWRP